MTALLEKTATAHGNREYLLLATFRRPTMQKELNQGGAKGFRLLPRTFAIAGDEGVAVMEKTQGPVKRYQYLLLETTRISTMEKELRQVSGEGYKLVAMRSQCGDLHNSHMVLLERPAGTATEAPTVPAQESRGDPMERYRVLGYEKVISEGLPAAGYRVITGSTHRCGVETILEKVTTPPETYDYVWLYSERSDVEQRLNEAATRGFRLLLGTVGSVFGKIFVVMEKEPHPRNFYEYHLLNHPILDRKHISIFQQEVNQVSEEGYTVASLYGGVILERPVVATSLNSLAGVYRKQGNYTEAEPLYQRTLAMREKSLGLEHLAVAPALENYAKLLRRTNREAEAEKMEARAQAIRAKHARWEKSVQAGGKARREKRYAEAEKLYLAAVKEVEKFEPQEPHLTQTAMTLTLLAELYRKQSKYAEAEPLLQRAVAIQEKVLGPEHPKLGDSLKTYADILGKMKRKAEAQKIKARAKAIRSKHKRWEKSMQGGWKALRKERYGEAQKKFLAAVNEAEKFEPQDPRLARTARTLTFLAQIYRRQANYDQAQPLFERALAIRERALGTKHPDVAISLNNLAVFYGEEGQYAEAEPLFRRALAIQEKTLGPEHPHVAKTLENCAALLRKLGREDEAQEMEARVQSIRAKHAQEK